MRRNPSTIVVLAGQVPAEVLAAASRSMNVALYRPQALDGAEGDDGGLAAEPAQQAEGVLHALGSLRHGPWWPGLDQVIETARRFYPSSLTETESVTLAGGLDRAG